jgi:hypothetical protein
MPEPEISPDALALLREMEFVPQVVGYDHRIKELDEAKPRLIEWESGWGYIASAAGRALLAALPGAA